MGCDKTGETEVHVTFNDIYVVTGGHAKITVGGQVTGNRETGQLTYVLVKTPK